MHPKQQLVAGDAVNMTETTDSTHRPTGDVSGAVSGALVVSEVLQEALTKKVCAKEAQIEVKET